MTHPRSDADPWAPAWAHADRLLAEHLATPTWQEEAYRVFAERFDAWLTVPPPYRPGLADWMGRRVPAWAADLAHRPTGAVAHFQLHPTGAVTRPRATATPAPALDRGRLAEHAIRGHAARDTTPTGPYRFRTAPTLAPRPVRTDLRAAVREAADRWEATARATAFTRETLRRILEPLHPNPGPDLPSPALDDPCPACGRHETTRVRYDDHPLDGDRFTGTVLTCPNLDPDRVIIRGAAT